MIHCTMLRDGHPWPCADLVEGLGLDRPGPLLVIAPHDDDAVLGCGLGIQAAQQAGMEVHLAVVTDGRMGYVEPAGREALVAIRAAELERSSAILGIPAAHIHRLEFPDGATGRWAGCHETPAGPRGISRSLCAVLRQVAPLAVCCPTPADLHPDHRVTCAETEIACFHAQAAIWAELGAPVALPQLFHYACYCPFDRQPSLRLVAEAAEEERRQAAIAAFASQPGLIAALCARLRAAGPIEILAHRPWPAYDPAIYNPLFGAC
jgi:LmbE family N-acetylglucosaminyl deacetylase